MNPIFETVTDPTRQLPSFNNSITRVQYEQVTCDRGLAGDQFPNGLQSFKWSTAGNRQTLFQRTFIANRISLSKGLGGGLSTPFLPADGVSFNQNVCANLYQSLELLVDGKSLCKVTDNVAQVDMLNLRLNKSRSWMNGVGASTNFVQSRYTDRLNLTCLGSKEISVYSGTDTALTGLTAGELLNTNTSPNFEFIWQPPLPIFEWAKAMPSCKFELRLVPQTANTYPIAAIESRTAQVATTVAARALNGVVVNVISSYLYVATVEGPPVPSEQSFYVNLDNIRIQTSDLVNPTALTQSTFDVSPATTKLTVAFQDSAILVDGTKSASKFKVNTVYTATGSTSDETKLTRLFVSYAGQQKPSPDADPAYSNTLTNYFTQRYAETQINCGGYFNNGSGEDMDEYVQNGPIYHFLWNKDGMDRSTRVVVSSQFSGGVACKVLLAEHYTSLARITIKDGRVVDLAVDNP